MKKLIFILFFLINFSGIAQENDIFDMANTAYADGNYEQAIELYTEILENGQTSAALHYNLGNAHYKLNHIAPSIYHYEKALQLDPTDEDIRNNLGFAQNMAIDSIEETPVEGFQRLFDTTTSAFGSTGWAWVAIFCMLLFVVFILVYYFSRRTVIKRILFVSGSFFFLLAIASAIIAFMKQDILQENSFAIIFSEEIEVKSEPNLRSEEVFQLHEGAKVRVTEEYQDWIEIELPNGSQGWVQQTEVKIL